MKLVTEDDYIPVANSTVTGDARNEYVSTKKENEAVSRGVKVKPVADDEETEANFKVETKSEVRKASEVVLIPEGSHSPSESSMKRRREIPIMTRPDIYKNGACPPP